MRQDEIRGNLKSQDVVGYYGIERFEVAGWHGKLIVVEFQVILSYVKVSKIR